MRERKITSYLRDFRESLEKKELAPLTIKNRMTSICSFYKSYNIQLPVIPKSTTKAKPQLKRKKIPTKEDIREVLKFCDPLERAIVLVGVSSGLAVTDISNLRISDFTEGYDKETGITTLHLIRQKMNYEFYTFLSPEASRAIQDYLEYRDRPGKNEDTGRINQLKKQRVVSKDGYLFITRTVPDKYLKITKEKEIEALRKLDEKSIMALYRRLSEEAQASAPHGEYNLIRSHNMQRFLNSTLLAGKASMFFVDFLLGHQLDATHEAYYRADPKSLREEYIKYVPYLTIQKEADISESPEYQRIKQENQILQTETARHVVERSELQELRAEIEKMKPIDSELERLLEKKMEEMVEARLNELLAKMT